MELTRKKPILFISLVYLITWFGWGFGVWQSQNGYSAGQLANIIANAAAGFSPLLVSLFLQRKLLLQRGFLRRLLFGQPQPLRNYAFATCLFASALAVYLLFGDTSGFSLSLLFSTWFSQCLLGGGMEELGWRGYLQPAFEKHLAPVPTSVLVGIVWSLWHLPLWLMPDSYQTGTSILLYMAHSIVLSLALGALLRLTGSVLVCVAYHGFTNAVFMLFPLTMSPAYWVAHVLEAALAVGLCLACHGSVNRRHSQKHSVV